MRSIGLATLIVTGLLITTALAHDSKNRTELLSYLQARINHACAAKAVSMQECREMRQSLAVVHKNKVTVGSAELTAVASLDAIVTFNHGKSPNDRARKALSDLSMAVALVSVTWGHVPKDHGGKWVRHARECEDKGYGLRRDNGKLVLVPPPNLARK